MHFTCKYHSMVQVSTHMKHRYNPLNRNSSNDSLVSQHSTGSINLARQRATIKQKLTSKNTSHTAQKLRTFPLANNV